MKDPVKYKKDIENVCQTYREAPEGYMGGTHTISCDEKTSIQALEEIHPRKPVQHGRCERREFEYRRHGTICLTVSFEVATGEISAYTLQPTRDEQDFANHIERTVLQDPDAKWIFVVDQLNTHQSETLAKRVANWCGIEDDLGKKGKQGVLASKESRAKFLADLSHRVRFVYTPKHASWLNQVEIWFSVLSRRLLKNSSFASIEELKCKIEAFIKYFNEVLAKPYRWTYSGKVLQSS